MSEPAGDAGMSQAASPAPAADASTDVAGRRVEIVRAQLPLHCPLDATPLWCSHPRVFLPIEKTGRALCPYCGTRYVLTD